MLSDLVVRRAQENRADPFCYFEDQVITFGQLHSGSTRLARGLAGAGVRVGGRVGVMLPSHPDHVYTFIALALLGATHVPINVQHRAHGIRSLLEHAAIDTLIADSGYEHEVTLALEQMAARPSVIWRRPGTAFVDALPASRVPSPESGPSDPDRLAMILYTSGTTGPQKGVPVTGRMYQTAAKNAGVAADVRPGDVMFLWEPLYHVAGVQTIILSLQQGIPCAMVERFSASRFWEQVRRYRATQIHYLGGVLRLLLKQPPRPDDRSHAVRIAYGAPAPPDVWTEFEWRFGVQIRECYGMTEASSFTTINTGGKVGSIGTPVPEFEVAIVDDEDRPLPDGQVGEIVQREKTPGTLMRGYLNDPGATAAAFREGWFHTGDRGYRDAEGFYYFAGRKKDVIRTRGENVSAWVVERAAAGFPDVEECAAIGVPSDLGEEDIKLFVRPVPGRTVDPAALAGWCADRLARFEVPRYIAFIEQFPKTPSERIRKAELSRSTDCWDSESSTERQ